MYSNFKPCIYKLINKSILIICFIFLTACTTDFRTARIDDPDEKPEKIIDLMDSEVFDYKLGFSLIRNLEEVEINIISPFNANEIPERIEKWLSSVDEHGGKVTMIMDSKYPKQRGLISEAIDLVLSAYESIKKNVLYTATDDYNAEVFYNVNTGGITKIVFVFKKENIAIE